MTVFGNCMRKMECRNLGLYLKIIVVNEIINVVTIGFMDVTTGR